MGLPHIMSSIRGEPLLGKNHEEGELLNFGYNNISFLDKVKQRNTKYDKEITQIFRIAESEDNLTGLWQTIGYQRYHTTIVRYTEWFVHLQRVMRLLMRDQLNWVNDPIVHRSNVINEQVTEYSSNAKFELSDFE